MVFKEVTLTLEDNLLINEKEKFVYEIINNIIKCEKLVINGTTNSFHPDFCGSSLFKEFWMKLKESVLTLELNEPPPVSYLPYLDYLTSVKSVSIKPFGIYQDTLKTLQEKKLPIEEISLNDQFINSLNTETSKSFYGIIPFNNTAKLAEVLNLFKSTLKCLTIDCLIPLQKDALESVFFELNALVWTAHDVIFDMDPIPRESVDLKMERVKLNLITQGEITKLLVQPLCIGEIFNVKRNCCWNSSSCDKHDFFKSEAVQKISFMDIPRCKKFTKTMYQSFQFIKVLEKVEVNDADILKLISQHLNHLEDLHIEFHSKDLLSLKPLPTVKNFYISARELTKVQFDEFILAMENLTTLSIEINQEENGENVSEYENYVVTITENLKNLVYLSIKSATQKIIYKYVKFSLMPTSLDLIGFKLKKLKELHTDCFVPFSLIEETFNKYPHWEVFCYGYGTLQRREKTSLCQKQITDLPPELLEKIFLYLKQFEQQNCRLVCKNWFNIQVLSPKINSSLNFYNTYFSQAIEPVTVFINTNFTYDKIILSDTTFAKDEDLTSFWKKIGKNVQEIIIGSRYFNIMAAVKSGFKASYFPKLKKITIEILPLFYELIAENINEWNLLLNQVKHLSMNYLFDYIQTKDVQFSMPNVTQLTIDGCTKDITDEFFKRISLPKLQHLIILHVSFEQIDLEHLFNTNFNFQQLETLFLGNHRPWNQLTFPLITQHCLNLENLGIGKFCTDSDGYITDNFDYSTIMKKFFNDSTSLKAIYFVRFLKPLKRRYKRCKSFKRKEHDIKESTEEFHLFDQIGPELFDDL